MQMAHSLATLEKPTSPQANWIAADEGASKNYLSMTTLTAMAQIHRR
jgi:hypothetical protein